MSKADLIQLVGDAEICIQFLLDEGLLNTMKFCSECDVHELLLTVYHSYQIVDPVTGVHANTECDDHELLDSISFLPGCRSCHRCSHKY